MTGLSECKICLWSEPGKPRCKFDATELHARIHQNSGRIAGMQIATIAACLGHHSD